MSLDKTETGLVRSFCSDIELNFVGWLSFGGNFTVLKSGVLRPFHINILEVSICYSMLVVQLHPMLGENIHGIKVKLPKIKIM